MFFFTLRIIFTLIIIFRLPQDLYQTAKVVKVLLLLEKGKGKEFRGKNLEEINLDQDCYMSDASDVEDKNEVDITIRKRKRFNDDRDIIKKMQEQTEDEGKCRIDENDGKVRKEKAKDENSKDLRKDEEIGSSKKEEKYEEIGSSKKEGKYKEIDDSKEKNIEIQIKDEGTLRLKPVAGRSRWTSAEKKLTQLYFRKHIKNRITPKKHECNQFFSKYGDKMIIKDWVKVKTFVYNSFRQK